MRSNTTNEESSRDSLGKSLVPSPRSIFGQVKANPSGQNFVLEIWRESRNMRDPGEGTLNCQKMTRIRIHETFRQSQNKKNGLHNPIKRCIN